MAEVAALEVQALRHRYAQRLALDGLSLQVKPGEVFVVLGPNGGGKTTLFRLICTLLPVQEGEVTVMGHSVQTQRDEVRKLLGVVFQSPSLDVKLTVEENLAQQSALYGLTRNQRDTRRNELLSRFGLSDRRYERAETLSGGLRRRLDLAKGLLHQPKIVLLDEPTGGLDPGARADVWHYLFQMRHEQSITVLATSHLMEEAERADRVAIIHEGRLVALGQPEELKQSIGNDSVSIVASDPPGLCQQLTERWDCDARVVDREIRIHTSEGKRLMQMIIEQYRDSLESITLSRPSLEDVFMARTGHRYWQEPN